MADVARLGLSVDSSDVKKGEKSLDGLTNAAKRAEAAASAVGSEYANAAAHVANAARSAERAIDGQAASAMAAANASRRLSQAVNDNAHVARVGSYHAANLAAQFQDVAVTAAAGQNPLQIALQQGTQMAMVFSAMANEGARGASTLSLLASAFATVLSPTALVVIAITALSAGLIELVPWAKLAQATLNGLAAILPTIAPYAAVAAAGLALLYAPQIIAGVTSVVALIARLTVSLVALAATAAAANPFAAFVLGTAVAVAALSAFRKDLTRVFGVDIIGAVKTGVNYIIGSFVAAFADIKYLWKTLPDLVGQVTVAAANLYIRYVETMINAAIGLINQLVAGANAALSNIPGGFQLGQVGTVSLGQIAAPAGDAGALAARNKEVQGALSRDYLGQVGTAISKTATAASAKLKEWSAALTEIDDKTKKHKKTEAEMYADIVSAADRRIALLRAEAQGLGLTEEAAARVKYEQELLNQANQKDITLSAAQRAELAAKAAEMAQVETAAKKVKEAFDFTRDAVKGFIDDLRSGLQQGQSFWEAFGNAAINVLNKIISKIEDELINALLKSLSVGGFNWGSLFSSSASFGSGGIGHAATGGRISGPGSRTSDTAGLFALSNGEFVVNAAATSRWLPLLQAINDNRAMRMAAGGGVGVARGGRAAAIGGVSVEVVNQTGVAADGRAEVRQGADGRQIVRLVLSEVKKEMATGGFDQTQRARFGNRPSPVTRG